MARGTRVYSADSPRANTRFPAATERSEVTDETRNGHPDPDETPLSDEHTAEGTAATPSRSESVAHLLQADGSDETAEPAQSLGAEKSGHGVSAKPVRKRTILAERAAAQRKRQRQKEKRRAIIVWSVIALVFVLIAALVVWLFVRGQSAAGENRRPANMASNGIILGAHEKAERQHATSLDNDAHKPIASMGDTAAIRVYVDYASPASKAYFESNRSVLKNYLDQDVARVEIFPIALLTSSSQGSKYATRAANAAGCVANYSPDSFYAFNQGLFDRQPQINTAGLSDDEIISIAKNAKADKMTRISACIRHQQYASWVQSATDSATSGPIAHSDVSKVSTLPLVLVNGKAFTGSVASREEFAAFVLQRTSADDASDSTPTPTSTP